MPLAFYNNQQQQVDFLKNVLDIDKNTKILDLGYGGGFHLTKLQEISDYVYGYDWQEVKEGGDTVANTKKLDFFKEEWDLKNLDLIYSFAPEYGEDWKNFDQLVSKVSQSLNSGGKFVLDLFDWNSISIGTKWKDWFLPKENVVVLNIYQRNQKEVICTRRRMIVKDNNLVEARKFNIVWRVFERTELVEIMQKHKLKLSGEFYKFDTSQPSDWLPKSENKRMVVVFTKE